MEKKPKLVKLELNTNYIDKIMHKYILQKYKDFSYEVYKSPTTNSIYLRLLYNGNDAWLRVSDHNTKANLETFNIADNNLNTNELLLIIERKIKKLYYKSKMIAFEKIEKELGER